MTHLLRLARNCTGSAAAEMALVAPILLVLTFGSVELGKYFLDEHIVTKAVRDGARYAARQQMANFVTTAGGCQDVPLGTVEQDTQNLVRTGNIAGTGTRLHYWTSSDTVEVTVDCFDIVDGEDMTGIYNGMTYAGAPVGAPVVTVRATVPYQAFFGSFALPEGLSLNATQQATVAGI